MDIGDNIKYKNIRDQIFDVEVLKITEGSAYFQGKITKGVHLGYIVHGTLKRIVKEESV
jgi:hypothetical protein